jgi:hypothetical protein
MTILAVTVTCSAVQAGTTIYVDATACPGPGAGTELDPYCSIQFAIDNSVDTDEIILAEGTYVESIDLDGRAITLRSTDPLDPAVVGATVIDGNGAFHVVRMVRLRTTTVAAACTVSTPARPSRDVSSPGTSPSARVAA